MNKNIELILYYFDDDNGFFNEFHEKKFFNIIKFNKLLNGIKELKKDKLKIDEYNKNLIYKLIHKIFYLLSTESDLRIGIYSLKNLSETEFFEYMEEFIYEIKSLFRDDWELDFHGNKY